MRLRRRCPCVQDDFQRAKAIVEQWGHFQLGWTEVDPEISGTRVGDKVCVCARILGIWIRNPLQIVYNESEKKPGGDARGRVESFSFAHGCLEGHMLAGEERFAVELLKDDDSVWYEVLAFSRPAHPLAYLSYPVVRLLQMRFARDSMHAVKAGMTMSDQCQ